MIIPKSQQPCCIVLVRTKFDGNLGSVARAMLNFGISDLRLVNPIADRLSLEARSLATHGATILEESQVFESLKDAVADCIWTGCLSARTGGLFRNQNVLTLQQGIQKAKAISNAGKVALIFGPEDHGLTNEEISLSNYLLTIPANPEYNVLNLAQAAVLSMYEWYQADVENEQQADETELANASQTQCMFEHLEKALRDIHFIWGEKGPSVFHALRHLLGRANLTQSENKLLHGLARQICWYIEHTEKPGKMPPESLEA